MNLTTYGAKIAQLELVDRTRHAALLLRGDTDIINYVDRGCCYDVTAYVRYLTSSKININTLIDTFGPGWRRIFDFNHGDRWDGESPITPGTAIGFYRIRDRTVFHAAVATSGTLIRSVNGGLLGSTWILNVDMRKVLGLSGIGGSFRHDGTDIFVFMSRV